MGGCSTKDLLALFFVIFFYIHCHSLVFQKLTLEPKDILVRARAVYLRSTTLRNTSNAYPILMRGCLPQRAESGASFNAAESCVCLSLCRPNLKSISASATECELLALRRRERSLGSEMKILGKAATLLPTHWMTRDTTLYILSLRLLLSLQCVECEYGSLLPEPWMLHHTDWRSHILCPGLHSLCT